MSRIIFLTLLFFPLLGNGHSEAVSGQNNQQGECTSWRCTNNCTNILSDVESALASVGVQNLLSCYMDLFFKESTCSPRLGQPQGTAGNPAEGFGLCTLETRDDLRRPRGRNCRAASLDNITAQVLCCRDIMRRHGGAYFGPVSTGAVARCERR